MGLAPRGPLRPRPHGGGRGFLELNCALGGRFAMAEAFDIAVIGGGPGGYVAAIRAAQLGMKTVVIEREHLGGICLNWGCIPTKALLRTAEVLTLVRHAEEFGLKTNGVTFDLAKVISRSRQVAGKLSSGVAYLLKKHKVAV